MFPMSCEDKANSKYKDSRTTEEPETKMRSKTRDTLAGNMKMHSDQKENLLKK